MAAMAIAKTEGALNGQVGDNGQSFGPFQFFRGGQLPNFARALGVSLAEAGHIAQAEPDVAVRWALQPGGYLGDVLRSGERQGLSGSRLATYGQTHGQVSVSPERAGSNYDSLWGDYDPGASGGQAAAVANSASPAPTLQDALGQAGQSIGGFFGNVGQGIGNLASSVAPTLQEAWAQVTGGGGQPSSKQLSQFGNTELSPQEAMAACGPAAAVRFAQYYGRNPTLREAVDLAKQVGWTQGGGMAGIGSEKALMDRLGVPTKQVGGDWNAIAQEASTGNPVTISTPFHYYFADGYDPSKGFHVGQSGLDLKGGSDWMTTDQIQQLGRGPVQGALFADHPQVGASSTASAPSLQDALSQSGGSSFSSPPSMQDALQQANWGSLSSVGQGAGEDDPDLMHHLGGSDPSNPDPGDIQNYIDQAARSRGIDPEVAMSVAYNEGGVDPQTGSIFQNPAVRGTFKTGSSWWPFQLHYGGAGYQQYGNVAGLGNEFTAATGYQPGDPAAWRASVDYALDTALQRGWDPTWYGSRTAGVSKWQGIPGRAA